MSTDPRYPIGKFDFATADLAQRQTYIQQVADAPSRIREAVAGLSNEQLDTPYRPEGWTVRQVVHHVPDSHMNAYTRFRLGLTEVEPAVKAYKESLWAELHDAKTMAVAPSLQLLEALHTRWVDLLRSMTPDQFSRTILHPEKGPVPLNSMLALYAWHGRHHAAQITSLKERMGWK
jgi:uncharacterized damage-inducible protein DinB